jgi:hypothetical protein
VTIDPRWSFFLSLFISVLNFFAGSAAQFTDLGMEQSTVKFILAAIALVTGVLSLINTALAAIPSRDTPDAAKSFYLGPKQP